MADIIKSMATWILGSLFLLLMFPVTLILWLVSYPFGFSSDIVHRWVTFQGIVLVRTIPLWKVRVEKGRLDCKGPFVVIANHQSLLDIPFMHLLNCNFRWISKIENFSTPLLGITMRMARYIEVERGNLTVWLSNDAKGGEDPGKWHSLIIFPEGTRL
ncbi:MAG: 1-acyl-sn-glycerol-3-phosphate acyltransferase [Bacteroidales bacterium]